MTCVNKQGLDVSYHLCDEKKKPKIRRRCSEFPCPYIWSTGPWSQVRIKSILQNIAHIIPEYHFQMHVQNASYLVKILKTQIDLEHMLYYLPITFFFGTLLKSDQLNLVLYNPILQ